MRTMIFLKKSFVSINDASSEVLIEQVKQQYRLSAAVDASDYFDFAVPHMMNHTIQIKISFNHYSHLVLTTITSLLYCIVYPEFLKLSTEPQKVHNKVATFAS